MCTSQVHVFLAPNGTNIQMIVLTHRIDYFQAIRVLGKSSFHAEMNHYASRKSKRTVVDRVVAKIVHIQGDIPHSDLNCRPLDAFEANTRLVFRECKQHHQPTTHALTRSYGSGVERQRTTSRGVTTFRARRNTFRRFPLFCSPAADTRTDTRDITFDGVELLL